VRIVTRLEGDEGKATELSDCLLLCTMDSLFELLLVASDEFRLELTAERNKFL
jgi:hypothetical protein